MSRSSKVAPILIVLFGLSAYVFYMTLEHTTQENYLLFGFVFLLFVIMYAVGVMDWTIIGAGVRIQRTVEKIERKRAEVTAIADGLDRKSTRLNSSHIPLSRMPSSA